MDNDTTSGASLNRRRVISGIAGVGAAALVGTTLARAQDSTSTPDTSTDPTTDTEDTTTPDERMAEQYQLFLTKLGSELSIADTATLDTGIRNALKAMVDDVLAAGDIAANAATEEKAEIDAAVAPIGLHGFHGGFGEGGRGGRFGGMGDQKGPGGQKPGDSDETKPGEDDSSVATPTA